MASEELQQYLAESFKTVLTSLLENGIDECNPDFRLIESVVADFDFTLNGMDVGGSDSNTSAAGQRVLQDSDGTDVPVFDGEFAFSAGPSASGTSAVDDLIASSRAPSGAPTPSAIGLDGADLTILMSVSGICNGCLNDIIASNQVADNVRALASSKGVSGNRAEKEAGFR